MLNLTIRYKSLTGALKYVNMFDNVNELKSKLDQNMEAFNEAEKALEEQRKITEQAAIEYYKAKSGLRVGDVIEHQHGNMKKAVVVDFIIGGWYGKDPNMVHAKLACMKKDGTVSDVYGDALAIYRGDVKVRILSRPKAFVMTSDQARRLKKLLADNPDTGYRCTTHHYLFEVDAYAHKREPRVSVDQINNFITVGDGPSDTISAIVAERLMKTVINVDRKLYEEVFKGVRIEGPEVGDNVVVANEDGQIFKTGKYEGHQDDTIIVDGKAITMATEGGVCTVHHLNPGPCL